MLTNYEQLGILILRMKVYKEAYANHPGGRQICKIAEYFVEFGAFFIEECIACGSHTKMNCIFTRKEVIIMGFFSKLFGKSERLPPLTATSSMLP